MCLSWLPNQNTPLHEVRGSFKLKGFFITFQTENKAHPCIPHNNSGSYDLMTYDFLLLIQKSG